MELLNLILASVERMGYSHLTLELFSAAILLFIYFGVRKINKYQKIILDKLDKHHDEMDPPHIYSKLNRFEDNLDKYQENLKEHQRDEVKQLHDVHNKVTEIDARLKSVRIFKKE